MTETISPNKLISPERISPNALGVIRHLKRAGFSALLVGGSVRDLLLNTRPRDFDVATDARPQQLRRLFRNSRLIGRRFRIVHIFFRREVIEVTTFRGAPRQGDEQQRKSANGRLLDDNVYGTIREDVTRRDFTVNALYYDPLKRKLLDFWSGTADLQSGLIRLIGEPEIRYREDPVRMLRAVRFAAKLNFDLVPETALPICHFGHLLADVAPARLRDEVQKLFLSGHARATLPLLVEHDLLPWLFPDTCNELHDPTSRALVEATLLNTDQRVAEGMPVSPAFLYAALLWPALVALMRKLSQKQLHERSSFLQAASTLIEKQRLRTSIPKWFSRQMREIWELQFLLEKRKEECPSHLSAHPGFRAGHDLLVLRAKAGEPLQDLADWWKIYRETDKVQRAVPAQQ